MNSDSYKFIKLYRIWTFVIKILSRNKTLTYIPIADNDSQYRTMDHQERRENIINIGISGKNIDVKWQCGNF